MNLLEKYVVTPEFLKRKDVYNINEGGDGGWRHVNYDLHLNGNKMFVKNMTVDDFKRRGQKANKTYHDRISKLSIDDQIKIKEKHREHAIKCGFINSFKGKHHTDEAKKKIGLSSAKHNAGTGNSMYGMHWIYNDELQLSFPVQENLYWDYIAAGWRKGSKRIYLNKHKNK